MFTAFAVGLGLTASLMAQVPNYVPKNGLVGWWPFNGNANDESGNGNNGTVNGATLTADRFGNVGKAYSFDGVNDKIDVTHSPNLSIFGDQSHSTISIWCYGNLNWTGELIGKGFHSVNVGNYGNKYLSICYDSQSYQYTLYDYSKLNSVRCPNGYFNPNQWYHLLFVRGSKMKVYVNGVDVSTSENNSGWLTNYNLVLDNTTMTFGSRNVRNDNNVPFNDFYFKGQIDDIGIWNRALTDQEISDLYNANICYEYVTVTDTLIINTGITGYNPITYLNTLKIWPNPTNDHITIDAGNLTTMNGYSIKIEDAQGKQVFQNALNQKQFYIDITTWGGNGLYFVRIIDPQGNTVDIKKIVLQ